MNREVLALFFFFKKKTSKEVHYRGKRPDKDHQVLKKHKETVTYNQWKFEMEGINNSK